MLVNVLRIMLMAKIGMFAAKLLLFFGLTVGVNKFVVDPATDQLRTIAQTGPSGEMGATVMAWAGVMQLDIALSMLLSAYAAAWTIKSGKAFLMSTGGTAP
ncbi:MAG: DUF2523 domain-containing protein [Lysobacter sp.]